ncbi:N-acetyltransferase [Providencia stuartii]|uniref:N-acetyltransferase n=1 Tax=Providencia TaxID=586 RepID=UPI0013A7578A|nr:MULTISPECIES: N-acetyltransferase [Providencia]MBQ0456067.1 N-acetyltransferase [Providencia stuartii]MDN7224007.1 N-acetyltransferase [Providencia stuartii]QIB29877.1 N-acetyltransferase [Providencia stuartii]QPN42189.1 N-acetyltransferase [Providencia sp. 2.29]WAZ77100.1 N-acetyltransferase [Providencia stuartii]
MDNLQYLPFNKIDLNDDFFSSLKDDYKHGFIDWFNKKASSQDEKAYVLYEDSGDIDGFMYLKIENGSIDDVSPPISHGKHLKVGTFKFEPKGTLRGQRFLKKIFDNALSFKVDDIYVTVFEKHDYLIRLFKMYGFNECGIKESKNGNEIVLLKDMKPEESTGDILSDYPLFPIEPIQNKYLLGIRPEFHTDLFPDSILVTESPDILRDISHTNSIRKVYICKMKQALSFKPYDILVIYRMGDGKGPAHYRSVATSVCIVENIKKMSDFESEELFVDYCIKYSVFTKEQLQEFYRDKVYPYIITFTYNLAFPRRPNRASLIENVGLDPDERWGILKLTDEQFNRILSLSGADESIIIN